MSNRIKIGIIGAGRVTVHHAKMLADVDQMELTAVCDLREDRGPELAGQWDVPWHQNYHEMLERHPEIDLVTVATPSGMHFEHVMDILKYHGKSIVVEKPTFMRPEQMRAAYELAKEKGARIFPVYQNRYNKAVRRVKEAVENKEIGDIRMASVRLRWCRPQRYYDRDPWRGTWSHDGGALTNQGVHFLDLLRYLAGDVASVTATKATLGAEIEVEDAVAATVKFKNGGIGVVEVTTAARHEDFEASISLVGSDGMAMISGEASNTLSVFTPDPAACAENSETFEIVYGYGHREMYKDIVGVLARNEDPPVSFDDGMATLCLLHGLYKSSETLDWVDIREENQSALLGRPDEKISSLYRTPAPENS